MGMVISVQECLLPQKNINKEKGVIKRLSIQFNKYIDNIDKEFTSTVFSRWRCQRAYHACFYGGDQSERGDYKEH